MRTRAAGAVLVVAALGLGCGACGSPDDYPRSVRLVGEDSDSVLLLELTQLPGSNASDLKVEGTYDTVSAVGGLMRQGHGTVKAELVGARETFTLTAGRGFEAPGSPLVVTGWLDRSRTGAWKSLTLTLPVESGEVRGLVLTNSTLGDYDEKVHDLAGVGEATPDTWALG